MNKLFADPLPKPDSYANRSPHALESKEPPSFDVGEIRDTDESPTTAIPGFEAYRAYDLPVLNIHPLSSSSKSKEAAEGSGSGTDSMFAL